MAATGTTSTTSSTNLGLSTTTCDPLFGTGCSDDILFGSTLESVNDYDDLYDNDYDGSNLYEDYDGSNPNDSVDPGDIDYVESASEGGAICGSKKVQI